MNGLDNAIVAVAIFGAVYGLARGVVRMATSAASLVAAIYVASVYHAAAAGRIESLLERIGRPAGETTATVLGYVALFAIVFFAVEMAGNVIIRLFNIAHLSWADRLGGSVVGAGVACVMAGLGVVALTAMLPPDSPTLRGSKLAPHVLAYNQALLGYVPPQVREAYQIRRDALTRYWIEHALMPTPAPSPGVATK